MTDGESFSRVPADVLVEILARVDGPSLASAACVCTGLRGAAKEDALWKELCHAAWPSTTETTARKLVSTIPGGFSRFYADSLPLLVYKHQRWRGTVTSSRSSDLVSFVDVYYKKRCVLSRVLHGIPQHGPAARFLEFPFRVDALGAIAVGGDETEAVPSISLEPKEEGGVGVLNWALEEDLTLSWVLLDVGRGRAVNVSSGRPTAVQRDWPSKGDLVARFSCPVAVEKELLACGLAECIISMQCGLSEEGDELNCTGIDLQVKDAEGALVDCHRSLTVLERALCYGKRTRNREAAARGYRAYTKDRNEMRKKLMECGLAEKLRLLGALLVLVGFCLWLL